MDTRDPKIEATAQGSTTIDGPLPVAALVSDALGRKILLPPRDLTVGRNPACDIVLNEREAVSRLHARLAWRGGNFEILDAGSTHGTHVNERRLEPGEAVVLANGDQLSFGDASYTFVTLGRETPLGAPKSETGLKRYSELARSLTSLDPREIVTRGLELLRTVSGVERSYLVGAGRVPSLEPLLTPLSDPDLHVSRSTIERAIAENRKVAHFLAPEGTQATQSMQALGLSRIWVAPIPGPDNAPVAAVYLDSPNTGAPFTASVEATLDTVTAHIGMALRNALLYAQVIDLNQNLEQKVVDRTRQLEASRAQLVAQDRLATLGRLVAAIAHELNNPVGAIASFANTLRGLVDPLLSLRTDLAAMFPEPARREQAEHLCGAVFTASQRISLDSRARRDLESRLLERMRQAATPAASSLAQRFARMGVAVEDIEAALPLLITHGEPLSARLEHLYTLGRSVETIGQCSANVARIVDGLKTYAHLDRSEAEVTDIHRSLEATLSVLGARIPKGIEVVTRFDTIAPFAHRPGELTQVWTNLVDNAVKAMGESGTLTVETDDVGDRVRITVADTGPGVPEPLRDRIFELDVTSRGPGAGLGLGLPICRTLIERNHGGRISFESRPGNTVFTVELPKTGSSG